MVSVTTRSSVSPAGWFSISADGRQAVQRRARDGRIVDVYGISAARDRVVELARCEHVVGGELVVAEHAARFAHADLHAALRDVRLLESRDVAPQELGDLAHL